MMCITCHMQDPRGTWTWNFAYHIGGLRNILYIGHRGEGHPAPWMMTRIGRLGLEVRMQRSRPWFQPELYRSSDTRVPAVCSLMIGNFIFAWQRTI